MNKPRVAAEEYIQFLVASPAAVSGTEAARVHAGALVAHDAYTRRLRRLEPDAATRWWEAPGLVTATSGVLVLNDTTLDKPYAQHRGLVTRHWSGKHCAAVQDINLLTRWWSDGQALVLVDYRRYEQASNPELHEAQRAPLAALAWGIEQYHRGPKQCCGVGKAQRNHIGCALRAFVRPEAQRLRTGRSWYEAKKQLLHDAIQTYLANPVYVLQLATA